MNMKRTRYAFLSLSLFVFSVSVAAAAPAYVYVPDMSQLRYQMQADGVVYFRNLDAFNNTVTGCCYAFKLDTTTPYGRSAWSTILMKVAMGAGLYLRVTDANPPTSGNPASIEQIGNW